MSDFFAMGGYGAFVWTAYGVTGLLLALLFIWSWHGARAREAELEQVRQAARAERQAPSSATLSASVSSGDSASSGHKPSDMSGGDAVPALDGSGGGTWSMRLRKQQRMLLIGVALLLLGGATVLVMTALTDSVAFFATPSDIAEGKVEAGKHFRVGGLVVDGSVGRRDDGVVTFALTDQANEIEVSYKGILPDLFREGQGIVAQGQIGTDGGFVASEVLAKHDENYMPAEVAESLKQAGMWNEGEGHGEAVAAPVNEGSAQ